MSYPLGDYSVVKVAQMYKSRRGGAYSCNESTFGQISLGVLGLHILGGGSNVGEQQFS